MLNLSPNKLIQIAKMRHIKGFKNMSKESLLSALNESESVESETSFDDKRLKRLDRILNQKEKRSEKSFIK